MGYFVIKKSEKNNSQPYYFLLKAANHETIATSEMYSSKEACKKGIASVQKNGPSTDVRDETV
ncbi:YegP family protein [Citrobacter sp. CtB7.12]|uniref:YegP family protein n=1 Tax=Citrobacter sp. CtB7.12 TaxID=1696093 RepID=UPI0006BA2628|nr:YegP family protein [Citrobacter sp. CtB7.12]